MIYEMRRLLAHTGKGARFLCLLLLRAPFDAINTITYAAFMQGAFDAIAAGDGEKLSIVCMVFALACLGLFLYNGLVWSVYAPFAVNMEGRLRRIMFKSITSLPGERVDSIGEGEWLTRLNADVQLPFSTSPHFPHAANALVSIIVSAIILARMSPAIFLLVMLFVIPHILVSQLAFARAMPALKRRSLEAAGANAGDLGAIITCADLSYLYGGREYLMARFEKSSLELMRANLRMARRSAGSAAVLPLFGLGGYLALLAVSAGWIAGGALSFGDLTAAFQYRGGVLVGAMTLINSLIPIMASTAGMKRLNETIEEGDPNV